MLEGKVAILIVFIMYCILVIIVEYLLPRGKLRFEVKDMPQLTALADAIDRCVEMGRPILYLTQEARFSQKTASDAIAAIDILSYVGTEAAKKDITLVASPLYGEVYPHYIETVREAYLSSGKQEMFRPELIRYYCDDGSVWIISQYRALKEYKPAALIEMGGIWDIAYYTTSYCILHNIDHIAISGTGSVGSLPNILIGSDEWLIGDEFYAAALKLSKKGTVRGELITSDFFKMAIIAFLLIGLVITALGSNIILNILST